MPTEDVRLCQRCNYITLCARQGATEEDIGPDSGWLAEDIDLALDLDEVPELEY
ncbi:MAG: hypothetical protein H5T69_18330 [Chloroflexi bacterium]|nr:hypothetical protein [Chloroflexota bacterium]